MPRYRVNATLNIPAWLDVEAETAAEAEAHAKTTSAWMFDYDIDDARVAFNVAPIVEEEEA